MAEQTPEQIAAAAAAAQTPEAKAAADQAAAAAKAAADASAAAANKEGAPKLDKDGKPIVEAKLDKDGKPIEQKPSEELRSLLDEASEKEVKLGPDGKPLPKEEAKKVVIPDKYEFKLPEGVTLDEAMIALVTPEFKALGLDNAQAQKLVDLQLSLTKASEDAHVQAWEAYKETQKSQSKEYFGTKLPEVMRNVARARDAFLPKTADGKEHPLLQKLNVAGFSNDKDFLEMMDKVGRVIGEGKFVEGKRSAPGAGKVGVETPTGKDATAADFYPSMKETANK